MSRNRHSANSSENDATMSRGGGVKAFLQGRLKKEVFEDDILDVPVEVEKMVTAQVPPKPELTKPKVSLGTRLSSLSGLSGRLFTMNTTPWSKMFAKKKQDNPAVTAVTKAAAKTKPKKPRSKFWRWVWPIVLIGTAIFLALSLGLLYILRDLPSPRRLASGDNFAVSSQIFDRKGRKLYEVFGDENRTPIKLNTLPPYVYQASISIEDKNFYHHFGFDISGMIRAARNSVSGSQLQGGSTITQQLVKNALLSPEKSFTRKIKEIILAVATELIYSKNQILEMYLNYISYGGTSVGIESAAQHYFRKSAKDLDLAEAAMLAGLPQSPTTYSPYGSNPEAAKQRQKEVLRRMVEDKYITQKQADDASAEVLHFAISKTDIQAPHFVFYVRDLLYQKYGVDKVEKGGLRVYTTLDLDLQNTAQASLSAEVDKLKVARVSNGAAMVIKPDTGEILAMIGSRDYFDTQDDGQVNVALALRQPGSSIKPIMYSTAFEQKLLNPGSMLLDIPTCFNEPNQKPYCPKNYDGGFRGPVTIRTSLGNSLNIPAVKALRIISVPTFIQQATAMGITTWTNPANYGLSLTLGGGEVRMIDLAQAFTTLANQGVKVPLTPILRVEDYQGNVLESIDTDERKKALSEMTNDETETANGDLTRVEDRAPAYLVSHIMQDNSARVMEFGPNSKLVIPNQIVSAKTGTTNDLKDNWTVGFTPQYLTITWVGNNNGTPMNQALVSGITGAAPIFNDIMSYVLKGKEPLWEEKPADVNSAQVCVTGFPPTAGQDCPMKTQDLYWIKSHPSNDSVVQKGVWIKDATGLPPAPGDTSTDGLSLQTRTLLSDPLTQDYCQDCARPLSPDGKTQYESRNVDSSFVIQDTSGDNGSPAASATP